VLDCFSDLIPAAAQTLFGLFAKVERQARAPRYRPGAAREAQPTWAHARALRINSHGKRADHPIFRPVGAV